MAENIYGYCFVLYVILVYAVAKGYDFKVFNCSFKFYDKCFFITFYNSEQ